MNGNMEKLHNMKAFICDMDGVIYHGNKLLPGVLKFIEWLKSENKRFLFLTNSSQRSPRELREKLLRLGVDVDESHFYTSSLATAEFLSRQCPNGSAFVIGEAGLINALYNVGFSINDVNPDYVVVGFTLDYNFRMLECASRLVSKGAKLIGTDPDLSFITEKGITPATGALIAPIELTTGDKAYYVGKPNPVMTRLALTKLNCSPQETALIGDRMDTDILAGIEAGITTVLVLSGVTNRDDLKHCSYQPNYILEGVRDIVTSLDDSQYMLKHDYAYGDGVALTIFQKVMILERISFFSRIEEEVLSKIASSLEEVEAKSGETIIEKGQPNTHLYLIVDGEVRVHDKQHDLMKFGKNETFGEKAILDPGSVASASVTALDNTRLLRLDQQTFFTVMGEHNEIVQNVLKVLGSI